MWSVNDLESGATTTTYTSNVCPTDCYRFLIEDSFGDGICCDVGQGEYSLFYQGELVSSGGEFGYSTEVYVGDGCNEQCDVEYSVIHLTITTDEYPDETSFFLINTQTDFTVWSVNGLEAKATTT